MLVGLQLVMRLTLGTQNSELGWLLFCKTKRVSSFQAVGLSGLHFACLSWRPRSLRLLPETFTPGSCSMSRHDFAESRLIWGDELMLTRVRAMMCGSNPLSGPTGPAVTKIINFGYRPIPFLRWQITMKLLLIAQVGHEAWLRLAHAYRHESIRSSSSLNTSCRHPSEYQVRPTTDYVTEYIRC